MEFHCIFHKDVFQDYSPLNRISPPPVCKRSLGPPALTLKDALFFACWCCSCSGSDSVELTINAPKHQITAAGAGVDASSDRPDLDVAT